MLNVNPRRHRCTPMALLCLGALFGSTALVAAAQNPTAPNEQSATAGSATKQAPADAHPSGNQIHGSIRGRVIDQAGIGIGQASVKLVRAGQPEGQEGLTDEAGYFTFSNVPPGPFQLDISSQDLAPQEISGTVQPGEIDVIPPVKLIISTQVTEVRVELSPIELAQAQIQDQEKQRVLGFIPNFYVSYVPNAAPLSPKQKFELAWKSSVDPVTFLGVGALAAAYQGLNRWKDYGQGLQGYGKRYGAVYADVVGGTFIGGAILPTILKQDPRYYYRGKGSTRSRLLYALSTTFICKGDNGKWEPNYSNVVGNFAAGGLSYLYYPANDRHGVSLLLSVALIRLGETTAASVFQEFLSTKLTPNLPPRDATQP